MALQRYVKTPPNWRWAGTNFIHLGKERDEMRSTARGTLGRWGSPCSRWGKRPLETKRRHWSALGRCATGGWLEPDEGVRKEGGTTKHRAQGKCTEQWGELRKQPPLLLGLLSPPSLPSTQVGLCLLLLPLLCLPTLVVYFFFSILISQTMKTEAFLTPLLN